MLAPGSELPEVGELYPEIFMNTYANNDNSTILIRRRYSTWAVS